MENLYDKKLMQQKSAHRRPVLPIMAAKQARFL
jgi:hypothetical protein